VHRRRRLPDYQLDAIVSLRAVRVAQIRNACARTVPAAASAVQRRVSPLRSLFWLQGFIDDVEFAVGAAGVQVRSASRVGKIDFLVNAKRLNLISERLRAKGWTAPAITQKTHPEYFRQG
jgi:uncharacterized protein (DUF1499 family)